MMNRVIILCIILIMGNVGICQKYFPFPKDSATWSDLEVVYYASGPIQTNCRTVHYGLYGDTIIDSIQYSKLFGLTSDYQILSTNSFSLLREDTTRKVWFKQISDTTEKLLYDFGLNDGDTFCYSMVCGGCYPVVIDSTLIQGEYRRRIYIDGASDSWIEGIGSENGLFECQLVGSFDNALRCYRENGNLIYEGFIHGGSQDCDCNSYNGIDGDLREHGLSINPNPILDNLFIKFQIIPKKKTYLHLYDISGRLLLETVLTHNETEISLSGYENGIYILKLQNSESVYVERIVKTTP